jgi:hypothetical protein
VRYTAFLKRVHSLLDPPTYLEIGVARGNSLALSRASTIGIDPEYEIKPQNQEATAHAALFRETSDDYFARDDPLEPFGGRPVSLAFIDGMHLVEFALRDFINVERLAHWSSVIVFDDILPREQVEANRNRTTVGWTGDIFKVLGILAEHRPDLVCLRVGTSPTGLLVVLALDPENRVLDREYDRIVEETVAPDPQEIPADVMERRGVLEPGRVLREGREAGMDQEEGVRRLRRAVRRDFSRLIPRPLRRFLPSPA